MKDVKPMYHIVGAMMGDDTADVTLDNGKTVRTSPIVRRYIYGGVVYIETQNSIYTNRT